MLTVNNYSSSTQHKILLSLKTKMWQEPSKQAGEEVFLLIALHFAVLDTANHVPHRIQLEATNKGKPRLCKAAEQQELIRYRQGIPALPVTAKDRQQQRTKHTNHYSSTMY